MGTEGEAGISSSVGLIRSEVFVFRLSWLGFLFIAGIVGLMNVEGDDGSDNSDEESELKGGWMDRPFMFFGRLGAGDVIGLSRLGALSDIVRLAMPDKPAKGVGAKDERGIRLTGESGDEDGEGSDRSDESVHDTVVVGEDSADSVVCVDVLSWCLWAESDGKVGGLSSGCEFPGNFVASIPITSLASRTVTRFWSIESFSKSNTDMNEGI